MQARLPWILFAVSLAANVFIVAGAAFTIYSKHETAESPEAGRDLVAERLGLSEDQREALRDLRERAEMRRYGMREAVGPMRQAILEHVASATFDRDRVMRLLEDWSEERRMYFAEYAEDLHGYLATLRPEQRARFLELAREPGILRLVFGRPRPTDQGPK